MHIRKIVWILHRAQVKTTRDFLIHRLTTVIMPGVRAQKILRQVKFIVISVSIQNAVIKEVKNRKHGKVTPFMFYFITQSVKFVRFR